MMTDLEATYLVNLIEALIDAKIRDARLDQGWESWTVIDAREKLRLKLQEVLL